MSPADAPPLEDLLRAANRGDQRAYGDFLREVTPLVRGIARARGGGLGADQIEDIVQETLLAIHQKRQTWREDMAGQAMALRHRALQGGGRVPGPGPADQRADRGFRRGAAGRGRGRPDRAQRRACG